MSLAFSVVKLLVYLSNLVGLMTDMGCVMQHLRRNNLGGDFFATDIGLLARINTSVQHLISRVRSVCLVTPRGLCLYSVE